MIIHHISRLQSFIPCIRSSLLHFAIKNPIKMSFSRSLYLNSYLGQNENEESALRNGKIKKLLKWYKAQTSRSLDHIEYDTVDKTTHELVYKANLFNYAFFPLCGALATSCFELYLIGNSIFEYINTGMITFNEAFMKDYLQFAIVISSLTIFNIIVLFVPQKAVLRIYYDTQNEIFVLICLHIIPFKTTKILCKPGEGKAFIAKSPIHNVLLFLSGNFQVKNKKLLVYDYYFSYPIYFNVLAGYQSKESLKFK